MKREKVGRWASRRLEFFHGLSLSHSSSTGEGLEEGGKAEAAGATCTGCNEFSAASTASQHLKLHARQINPPGSEVLFLDCARRPFYLYLNSKMERSRERTEAYTRGNSATNERTRFRDGGTG